MRKFRPHRRPTCEPLEPRLVLDGFTAYNGLFSSDHTHDNATFFADIAGKDAGGQLVDVESGDDTSVLMSTNAISAQFVGAGVNPSADTDANDIFGEFLDFSAGNARSIELGPDAAYEYNFENLDSGATYAFAGTAIHGNEDFTNRWTLVQLLGAAGFTPSHSTGPGVVTDGLNPNQVALWTGDNSTDSSGYIVQWLDIDPGHDGEFQIVSSQYTGTVPTSVHAGGTADGASGYALTGVRLIQNVATAAPTVQNASPSNVGPFDAVVGGNVVDSGGEVPDVRIYYGTADGGTSAQQWDEVIEFGDQSGEFSLVLGPLTDNQAYYYRAFAENSLGGTWAPTSEMFVTPQAFLPAVATLDAANVAPFSATLRGEVLDTGNHTPLVTMYYGMDDAGTDAAAWDHALPLNQQDGAFAVLATGLTASTEYFFTARAENAVGASWAATRSFETAESVATGSLRITEFLADNGRNMSTRIRASVGEQFVGSSLTPDWVEVFNPRQSVADISGYHLTDDVNDRLQWRFPPGTTIPPEGYLLVFASGEDVLDPELDERGRLHTNFRLRAGGEDLALTDPGGRVVHAYTDYPPQSEDISYGLSSELEKLFFARPTPALPNTDDAPHAPEFSVKSRTFTGSFELELIAGRPTDTIHFTLNETQPTGRSPVYNGPITIDNTTQVRAIAISESGVESARVSEAYIELTGRLNRSSSKLPYVIVDTFGDSIPGRGSSFGDSFFALIEPGEDGRSRLEDEFDIATRMGIHVRGSSSAGFAKKQYRVEFWNERNEDLEFSVLGMPEEADWILYGPNRYDRSFIANPLMYDLSNQIGQYATRTRWVEMYINTGGGLSTADYVGIYAIIEVIEGGADRVPIEPLSNGRGAPVDGGFIWKVDRGSPYVDPERLTTAQRQYIDGKINRFEAAANSRNYRDPVRGYEPHIDVLSFIDHNLLNTLAMNVDAYRLSAYYWYNAVDDKLIAGPIWDFDRSLESTDGRDNNPRAWFGTGDSSRPFTEDGRSRTWWRRLFQDPDFVQRYIDRWFELRETTFSIDHLFATIDKHAALLEESAPRDYLRWSGSRFGDFAGEIRHLKDWLQTRVLWMENHWMPPPKPDIENPFVEPGTAVNIRAEDRGVIYYTLDGTDPRGDGGSIAPNAIMLDGPLTIDDNTTIIARNYSRNFGRNNGYNTAGDDWSAPLTVSYITDTPADASNLRITEINYRPHDANPVEGLDELIINNDAYEFVELMNVSGATISLLGTHFDDGVQFDFTHSDVQQLAPAERVLVVRDAAAMESRYGAGLPIAGEFTDDTALANNGELLRLLDASGAVIQEFTYSDRGDWPGRADGNGSSLVIVDVQGDYNDPENWNSSIAFGGTPGEAPMSRIPDVVVNEILANTDDPVLDSFELFNTTGLPVDIGGWWFSDTNDDYFKFQVPDNTIIAGGDYLVFDERHFNPGRGALPTDFALSSGGDDVWAIAVDPTGRPVRFADRVEFDATETGVSLGRLPNGSGELFPLVETSLGGPNGAHQPGDVIITEVHYQPADAPLADPLTLEDLAYVELYNRSDRVQLLADWRLRGTADYDLPVHAVLQQGEALLIVSFDPNDQIVADAFRAHYTVADTVELFGPWEGHLDPTGGTVRLDRAASDGGSPDYFLHDRVRYRTTPPWPLAPNGDGPSLQRTTPGNYGDLATSWQAQAPTPGEAAFGPQLEADFDGSGSVTGDDFLAWQRGLGIDNGAARADGDANSDGAVSGADYDIWLLQFGGADVVPRRAADFNRDGAINDDDLADWQANFGIPQGAGQSDGDANDDGAIAGTDFLAWQSAATDAAMAVALGAGGKERAPVKALKLPAANDGTSPANKRHKLATRDAAFVELGPKRVTKRLVARGSHPERAALRLKLDRAFESLTE